MEAEKAFGHLEVVLTNSSAQLVNKKKVAYEDQLQTDSELE